MTELENIPEVLANDNARKRLEEVNQEIDKILQICIIYTTRDGERLSFHYRGNMSDMELQTFVSCAAHHILHVIMNKPM